MSEDWMLWPFLVVVALPFVAAAFLPPHSQSVSQPPPWMPEPSPIQSILDDLNKKDPA